MAISKEQKMKIVSEHRRERKDTGSPEVQIAMLTNRINDLSSHFEKNKKDHHSRFGLIRMVNRRRKLLKYLQETDFKSYQDLIKKLNIRK